MKAPHYGPFAPVFESGELDVPGHVCLLNLGHESHARTVIGRVRDALAAEEPGPWVERMLGQPNWRPHLVAAVAYLADDARRLAIEPLWRRLEDGSWVSPQLAVAAFFVDPAFPERFRARPLPANAKTVAALIGAASLADELAAEAARARHEPEIAPLLAKDASFDRSDDIVRSWAAAIAARFAELGLPLQRRWAGP